MRNGRTEADTCRTMITSKPQAAGWDTEPHSIAGQRMFTDGRVAVHGSRGRRRPGKRADYLLLPALLDRAFKRIVRSYGRAEKKALG
jgi:type I site-specific restriction endonuclease